MQVLNSISYIYYNLHCISFLVICVQCYVRPCGALVPTGTCTQIMNLNLNLIYTVLIHVGCHNPPGPVVELTL